MKVLFVSSGNLSKGLPSILVQNQGVSLIEQGIEVVYCTINGKGTLGYLKCIPSISKAIKDTQPSAVHSHYSLSAFATSICLFLYRIKLPHHVSLMGSDSKMKGWKRMFTRLLSKRAWDTTIVKADRMALDLSINNYKVIPNGVNINVLKPITYTFNRTIIFPADPARESKNFSLARDAFELAKKDIPELKLEICYGISHEKMIQKLQKAGAVLITSLWEGSPNIVKEAMALNKPIICTKVGDVEWLLKDVKGAFMVDFDSVQIADKLKKSIEFQKTSLECNGRDKIVSLQLDSVNIAKRLISLYEKE